MSNTVKETTDQTFADEVISADSPVIVDFWASWCAPCRMLSPILDKIAVEYQEKVKVVKLNTDENPQIATDYHISAIPTILFFKDGKVVNQVVGIKQPAELRKIIDEII
ncbi:MAG: thioredoxin [Planctomycetota bacterium]|nr:thioredoxin [Planctomycetota bacterium]MDI6787104.1 thioredoxin [Planctomycetota bacterium]